MEGGKHVLMKRWKKLTEKRLRLGEDLSRAERGLGQGKMKKCSSENARFTLKAARSDRRKRPQAGACPYICANAGFVVGCLPFAQGVNKNVDSVHLQTGETSSFPHVTPKW